MGIGPRRIPEACYRAICWTFVQASAGRDRVLLRWCVVEHDGGGPRANRLQEGFVRSKDERCRVEGVVGVDGNSRAEAETDAGRGKTVVQPLQEVLLDRVQRAMGLNLVCLENEDVEAVVFVARDAIHGAGRADQLAGKLWQRRGRPARV